MSGDDRDVTKLEYSPCSKLNMKREIANVYIVCRSNGCHTDDFFLFSVNIENSFIQSNLNMIIINMFVQLYKQLHFL